MRSITLLIGILILVSVSTAQRIAILHPAPEQSIPKFTSELRSRLSDRFKILDDSLADSAFRSVSVADPYNLSTAEARQVGEVIGVENFVLIRSAIQRRASLDGPAYFEAYAVAYVANSRAGSLILWYLESVRGANENEAAAKLIDAVPKVVAIIEMALKGNRFSIIRDPKFLEVPPENSSLAKGLRTPVPYRRIKPEYTDLASNYSVRATIDIEVDVEADGSIARTSIERWAGFGLEESVEKAVRSMNWRPAERDGKTLPMRILLRYNFTKIEKDEAP